jgi:hypothetical protein
MYFFLNVPTICICIVYNAEKNICIHYIWDRHTNAIRSNELTMNVGRLAGWSLKAVSSKEMEIKYLYNLHIGFGFQDFNPCTPKSQHCYSAAS